MSAQQSFPARKLTWTLAALMAAQAILGLVRRDLYRDAGWITATWLGNDGTTLLLAVPLLLTADVAMRRGSTRAHLVFLGVVAYSIYNYAFYLLGAALNAFFPLFAACVVVSGALLIQSVSRTDATAVARSFGTSTPARVIGGVMCFIATGLTAVWLTFWAWYVFAGRALPVEADAFRLVAALDLTLMVPMLFAGGALLWRRRPWGFVLAPMAGIQSALYLLVLAVNSVIAIRRDLVAAPGELPIWVPLALVLGAATAILLANQRHAAKERHS
jgi:hypothetical protein